MTSDKDKTARNLRISIATGPKCPRCGLDTFDDWHLERGLKSGHAPVSIQGRMRCHGCSRFFSIKLYNDGECHSTMWEKVA